MRQMGALFLLSFQLIVASAGDAHDLAFPGIVGGDDRRPVQTPDPKWNAIGKVQAAGYNWSIMCTGTLIAPDRVVTSARCLLGPNGTILSPHRIHFLAGVSGENWIAHATGACIRGLADIAPQLDIQNDVAVIVLNHSVDVLPIAMADDNSLGPGTAVMHAGYGRDRPYRLSVDSTCHVERVDPGLTTTDCDSNFGQIGGPATDRWRRGYSENSGSGGGQFGASAYLCSSGCIACRRDP